MKRIEVHTKTQHQRPILYALKKIGVGGITVIRARGRGSVEPPMISGLRGTARYVADFNPRTLIYTVVEDSKSEEAIQAILNVIDSEGDKVHGKIFVTHIEDVIDLRTGSRGSVARNKKSPV